MARKIRLDFSKVEERSGFNSRLIPDGLHSMKIESVQVTQAPDKTQMLVFGLRPTNPRYKTRLFPYYCKLSSNQLWKVRDLYTAVGIKVPKSVFQLDPDAPVGKVLAAEVEEESNPEYKDRSTVNGTYSVDILDEDGSDAGDEDDEDEEYDDEEVDEEDEGDEEEPEDDFESMTLAELRKLAKEYGISTVKKTKDDLIDEITDYLADNAEEDEDSDDEDDLDDEDLEDEDLDEDELEDDEEEEPEPAPRRRPTRAPAAKKPAAKAAPARRTVQRRR